MQQQDHKLKLQSLLEALAQLDNLEGQHATDAGPQSTMQINEKGQLLNEEGLQFMDIKEDYSTIIQTASAPSTSKSFKKKLDPVTMDYSKLGEFEKNMMSLLESLQDNEEGPSVSSEPSSVKETVRKQSIKDTSVKESDNVQETTEEDVELYLHGKQISEEYHSRRRRMILSGSISGSVDAESEVFEEQDFKDEGTDVDMKSMENEEESIPAEILDYVQQYAHPTSPVTKNQETAMPSLPSHRQTSTTRDFKPKKSLFRQSLEQRKRQSD